MSQREFIYSTDSYPSKILVNIDDDLKYINLKDVRDTDKSLLSERVKIYSEFIQRKYEQTPHESDLSVLWQTWLKDQTYLLARVLIQPEDLIDLLSSRNVTIESTEQYLQTNNRKWVLRPSPVKTENPQLLRIYVLSFYDYRNMISADVKINHFCIVHRIGIGYYYGVVVAQSEVLLTKDFQYIKAYPTILDLIREILY